MSFTFSIGIAPGYVETDPKNDIAPGMDVVDAAFLTGQNHPGGVAALAVRMGVNAGTLQHKLNPNNATHHLTLPEAVRMQAVTGDVSVLRAMAHQLGYVAWRAMPDQAEADPVEAFMHFQTAVAEVTRAAADLLRPEGRASRNGVRRLDQQLQDLMTVAGYLSRAAEARLGGGPGDDDAN
ncbi:MAG: phage regulatory CII family protein [Pseudomonadales bacterium]|jgi:hypothetical protein|uniref:phage regulatory CII family protein n=1 Tax=Delftia acidovorans TaxID=80866 RepID=UPI0032DEAC36